jgi:cellulose biosynthesis protein BcsQ
VSESVPPQPDVRPAHGPPEEASAPRPRARVLTVSSNKGGVGKTTVASNLAVYVRALREDLPVLVVGLDDQGTLDRMFALRPPTPADGNLKHVFAERSFDRVAQLGEYGVHFVPSPPDLPSLKARAEDPGVLSRIVARSHWNGLVIFDTKSDLEALTHNALVAADLVLIPVADWASLEEAAKTMALLTREKRASRGRILLTLADARTRIDEQGHDLRGRLEQEIDRRGYRRCTTFLSRSPRVEALNSGTGRPLSILHHAQGTNVHRQMRALADEVLLELGLADASPAREEARRAPRRAAPGRASAAGEGFDWKQTLLKGLRGW